MNVRAGTYSGYVVGRSGLNSKQADRRNSAYDRAIDTFVAWQKANQDRVRQAAWTPVPTRKRRQIARPPSRPGRQGAAQGRRGPQPDAQDSVLEEGHEPVAITKTAHLAGVNFGKDGYPTSIKLTPTDGSVLTATSSTCDAVP
ncbi:hypothetical protein MNU23_31405 [Pseudomonas aeruginosa]|uniref:hypothetical protein n=1 Tax=Pseudomonas aeruginosa TaxID=287 RepID=UPI0021A6EC28|nr:hypothetical protein [Pseudomonas aeruginosa]MCT2416180.1 hypothetical protein [Pseudomonas aeruginosa]